MKYQKNPWFKKKKQKYGFYPLNIYGWLVLIFSIAVILYLLEMAYTSDRPSLLFLIIGWIFLIKVIFRYKRDRLAGWRRHIKKIKKRRENKRCR